MNRPSPSFSVFRLALVGAFLLIFALFNPQANGWPIRGMAYFLAFRPYRPERVAEDLRRIRELGFNWVSLDVALTQETATSSEVYLPYGDGSYVHPALPYRYEPEAWFHFPPEWAVGHFVTTAHRLGLRVLFKPHVHPKDSGMRVLLPDGSGRDPMLAAAILADDPERWFRSYGEVLRYYAATYPFDAICVGGELSGMYRYGDEWRSLIAQLRRITSVPLTCSFNWWVALHHQFRGLLRVVRWLRGEDDLLRSLLRRHGYRVEFDPGAERRIATNAFWEYPDWADRLDWLGITFYFPLASEPSPSLELLRERWHRYPIPTPLGTLSAHYVESLQDWAERFQKPLLFTEGGWGKWKGAAAYPANWHASAAGTDLALQARCYEAFFQEAAPLAMGMFFWDWAEPGFSPAGGPAEAVIRQYFGVQAADPLSY